MRERKARRFPFLVMPAITTTNNVFLLDIVKQIQTMNGG